MTKRCGKWLGLLAVLALPVILLLGVSVPLTCLSQASGVEWAYSLFGKDHLLNFGGNPAEVLSHLLNWIVMTSCVTSLGAAAVAASVLKWTPGSPEPLRSYPWIMFALTVFVAVVWAGQLDRQHGEGTVLLGFTLFFGPFTLLMAFAIKKLLRCSKSPKVELIPIPILLIASILLQWVYEPSGTGGPNMLVLPALLFLAASFWTYCFAATRTQRCPA